ncbi:MAG: nitroreductase family protein [Candidatus Pelagadaptatus aseana]
MFKAALRAADHGCLRPWRFLVLEGEALDNLGQLFLKAAQADEPQLNEVQQSRYLKMPKRAPLMIVAISKNQEHPKVSVLEQQMAVAAATQNLITAAFAQGVGAYWRTGAMAESAVVKEGLGIKQEETIVGFIYLGTPAIPVKQAPSLSTEEFFIPWQG